VVGVDGSRGSRHALQWAVSLFADTAPIKPVVTFTVGPFADGLGTIRGVEPDGEPYRQEAFDRLASVVDAIDPSLTAGARAIDQFAGPGLVEAANDAVLLVVGSRGRSVTKELVLGSVATYCVKHATVPVAVIPEGAWTEARLRRIVVGVDGSAASAGALRWALDNAERSGEVVAVVVTEGDAEMERTARAQIEACVGEGRRPDGGLTGGPTVGVEVRPGKPGSVLQEVALAADALLVGRSGGSLGPRPVSTWLSHRVAGPTVVVPGP